MPVPAVHTGDGWRAVRQLRRFEFASNSKMRRSPGSVLADTAVVAGRLVGIIILVALTERPGPDLHLRRIDNENRGCGQPQNGRSFRRHPRADRASGLQY